MTGRSDPRRMFAHGTGTAQIPAPLTTPTPPLRMWMPAIPAALAAMPYTRFFAGYWLGDDFGALANGLHAAQRGETLHQAWAYLFAPVRRSLADQQPSFLRLQRRRVARGPKLCAHRRRVARTRSANGQPGAPST